MPQSCARLCRLPETIPKEPALSTLTDVIKDHRELRMQLITASDEDLFQLIVSALGLMRDRKRTQDLLIIAAICLRKVHLTDWQLRHDALNKARIRNVRDQLRFILRDFGPL